MSWLDNIGQALRRLVGLGQGSKGPGPSAPTPPEEPEPQVVPSPATPSESVVFTSPVSDVEYVQPDNPRMHKAMWRIHPEGGVSLNDIADLINAIPTHKMYAVIILAERDRIYHDQQSSTDYISFLTSYEHFIGSYNDPATELASDWANEVQGPYYPKVISVLEVSVLDFFPPERV